MVTGDEYTAYGADRQDVAPWFAIVCVDCRHAEVYLQSMRNPPALGRSLPGINPGAVSGYVVTLGIVFAAFLVYALLRKPLYLWAAAGLPVALLVVSNPRVALWQFVFVLFIYVPAIRSIPLYLVDISAMLAILAAALDLFLRGGGPGRPPLLAGNYLAILAALAIAGLFSYDPSRALRPLLRVGVLFVTFLSVYRLAGRADVARMLSLFFGLCAVYSAFVVGQFLAGGGSVRVFGLARVAFDELAMLALPVGVALFLWSSDRRAIPYLIGSVLVAGALVATQSRASILFGFTAAFLALAITFLRVRRMRGATGLAGADAGLVLTARSAGRRSGALVVSFLVLAATVMVLQQGLFQGVLARFEGLFTSRPGGTFLLRITLWKTALAAFWDHPLLGVGPGMFRRISDVYTTIHLDPTFLWVRGKSAHNLFLHYLAETGLVGAAALLALFVNQLRLIRRRWVRVADPNRFGPTLALYLCGLLLLATTLLEAGWMWGQTGFIAVFFLAVIARQADRDRRASLRSVTAAGLAESESTPG